MVRIPGTTFSDYTPKIDWEKAYHDLVEHIKKNAQDIGVPSEDDPTVIVDQIITYIKEVQGRRGSDGGQLSGNSISP